MNPRTRHSLPALGCVLLLAGGSVRAAEPAAPAAPAAQQVPEESITVEVERPAGRLQVHHAFEDASDGAIHLVPDGRWTWVLTLSRDAYDGRVEACVAVARRNRRGKVEDLGRPCVAVRGPQAPRASVETAAGRSILRLTLER